MIRTERKIFDKMTNSSESGSELFVKAIYENTKRPPRCKICGATKILFIDGTFVCDACEVGGIRP